MKWFSYNPNGNGLERHATAEAAEKAAVAALDWERENAVDGWSDEVIEICWGELRGVTVEMSRVETPGGDFDYRATYELQPTTQGNAE